MFGMAGGRVSVGNLDCLLLLQYAFASSQEDPLTLINEKEERTKAAWVKIMGAREARNDLRECYR